MRKTSKSHHSSLNELNITPLLDLAFVLLVIFIITTPQMSNDLELSLPTPKKDNQPAPSPKVNRILVSQAGQISLNGQNMELPSLKQALTTLVTDDKDTSVVVLGAADVDYQRVISVLDILQQAEVTKVGLATVTTP